MKKYIIDQIIDSSIIDDRKFYLIKWKDLSISESTWEPESSLKNFKKEI